MEEVIQNLERIATSNFNLFMYYNKKSEFKEVELCKKRLELVNKSIKILKEYRKLC